MALKDKLMERAQSFVQKGALDKAIVEYKAVYDADPKDISIRLRIGDLYVKMGNKTDAVQEYKEVAKSNSQRGFYLKAIAVYKQILKLEETNYEVHYKLAELYAKQRLISDAISEYSYLVSSFEKKGKTGEVLQLIKEMLDIDTENIGVRLRLAEMYQKLNFENDALSEYAIIFKKYFAQDKLDKAEKIYTTLHKTYPKDIRILKGLADLYRKRHDNEKFLQFSKAAFKVYVERHDDENAKAVAESILEVVPVDQDCLVHLGRAKKAPPVVESAPLISFPDLSVEPTMEAAPLISFPEIEPPAKPEEAASQFLQPEDEEPAPLLQPEEAAMPLQSEEEEPLISFPMEDTEGAQEEVASVEHVFEIMLEEASADVFVPEEAVGEQPEMEFEMDVEEEEKPAGAEPEIEFEMPGVAAQREVDAILNAVAEPPAQAPIEQTIEFESLPETKEEPVTEFIFEEVKPDAQGGGPEPDGSVEAEVSLLTHDDLAKSIIELTELHEIEEMPVEPEGGQFNEAVSIIEEETPAAEVKPEETQSQRGEDFVDLSKELGMEEALSDLAGSWGEGGAKETYDEFKTGIGNQLNKEDSETHFNLGIAYMEMELISEAMKEFKIALKDPRLEFDCYTRLALCSMADNNPNEAIVYYTKGLRVVDRSDDERKGMMYELALAYEAADKLEEAGKLYSAINAIDPGYRETAKKVKIITESVHLIPMADGMLEVELM